MSKVDYSPTIQVSLQMIADQLKKLEPQLFKEMNDTKEVGQISQIKIKQTDNFTHDYLVLHNEGIQKDMVYTAVGLLTQDTQRGAEPEPFFIVIKLYDPYYFTEDRVTNKVLSEPLIRESFRFPGMVITEAQALEVAQFIAAKHHQLVGFGFPLSSSI